MLAASASVADSSARSRSVPATGSRTVRLDTNRALVEAIALYRSTGYVEVSPFNDETYADFWFSKRLRR